MAGLARVALLLPPGFPPQMFKPLRAGMLAQAEKFMAEPPSKARSSERQRSRLLIYKKKCRLRTSSLYIQLYFT